MMWQPPLLRPLLLLVSQELRLEWMQGPLLWQMWQPPLLRPLLLLASQELRLEWMQGLLLQLMTQPPLPRLLLQWPTLWMLAKPSFHTLEIPPWCRLGIRGLGRLSGEEPPKSANWLQEMAEERRERGRALIGTGRELSTRNCGRGRG